MDYLVERTSAEDTPSSPERKVLSATIAQAVVDLASPYRQIREDAIKWFLGPVEGAPPNPMLEWLCDCLGYHIPHVQETVRVMVAMPRHELAEVIKGLVEDVRLGRPALGLLALQRRAA